MNVELLSYTLVHSAWLYFPYKCNILILSFKKNEVSTVKKTIIHYQLKRNQQFSDHSASDVDRPILDILNNASSTSSSSHSNLGWSMKIEFDMYEYILPYFVTDVKSILLRHFKNTVLIDLKHYLLHYMQPAKYMQYFYKQRVSLEKRVTNSERSDHYPITKSNYLGNEKLASAVLKWQSLQKVTGNHFTFIDWNHVSYFLSKNCLPKNVPFYDFWNHFDEVIFCENNFTESQQKIWRYIDKFPKTWELFQKAFQEIKVHNTIDLNCCFQLPENVKDWFTFGSKYCFCEIPYIQFTYLFKKKLLTLRDNFFNVEKDKYIIQKEPTVPLIPIQSHLDVFTSKHEYWLVYYAKSKIGSLLQSLGELSKKFIYNVLLGLLIKRRFFIICMFREISVLRSENFLDSFLWDQLYFDLLPKKNNITSYINKVDLGDFGIIWNSCIESYKFYNLKT